MKKVISLIVTLAMMLSLSFSAFASEIPAIPDISVSDVYYNTIAPRSTIGGYAQGTISKSNPHIVVYSENASGIGGMGVTVKLSRS